MPTISQRKSKSGNSDPKIAIFTVETALLEELGERLVAVPEVALTELIKNSYDADAKKCKVTISKNKVVVTDDGNGMTEKEFRDFWMVIGTRAKARKNTSPIFNRKVSGSKGIGRFAVRFLGSMLKLNTVAYDSASKKTFEINAIFDWNTVSEQDSLTEVKIPYYVTEVSNKTPGTTLEISRLRKGVKEANISAIASQTLALVSPLEGLEKPKFTELSVSDPGFSVVFDGESDIEDGEAIQQKILDAYVARARIELNNTKVKVTVTFDRGKSIVFNKTIQLTNFYSDFKIDTPLFIDIRYFPYRKGTFSDIGVNGKKAQKWLKENSGIAIIDNGFRILPYGTKDDDWLKLNVDSAQNVRDKWRSDIMRKLFPLPPNASEPRNNPLLYLPSSGQVFGAVFVASQGSLRKDSPYHLTASMDRQGYVGNKAFDFVRGLSRFGLELIAYFDHQLVRKAQEEAISEQLEEAEEDLTSAIKEIRQSDTIDSDEKNRLVSLLTVAASGYKEVDDYRKKAQESLETMSLLGVLAGFMTHEFEQTMFKLNEVTAIIKKISRSNKELRGQLGKIEDSIQHLESFLDYSKLFTEKLGDDGGNDYQVGPQIQFVIDTLMSVRDKHGINIDVQLPDYIESPNVPLSAYSGILLNLLTNAFKALITRVDGEPRNIRIIASSNDKKHILIIADNGIGIPTRLRRRIWEPLFTTTKPNINPMGTGMGLGLAIVKRVVNHVGGEIKLCETIPPGYSTAFQVELPV